MRHLLLGSTVLTILMASLALFDQRVACAEDAVDGESHESVRCDVRIRVLKARRDENGAEKKSTTSDEKKTGGGLDASPMLHDVKSQLQTLPFHDYQIVDTVEEQIQLGAVRNVSLREDDGTVHSLRLQPLQFVNGRVAMDLRWRGPNGERLVETKLKFTNGKSMVLGADKSEHASTVLCVRLNCQE